MADILNSKKENVGGGGAQAGHLLHRCGEQAVSVFLLFQLFHSPSILPSPKKRLCQMWLKFTQVFFQTKMKKYTEHTESISTCSSYELKRVGAVGQRNQPMSCRQNLVGGEEVTSSLFILLQK